MRRMSESQGQPRRLALAQLHTVEWVAQQRPVKSTLQLAASYYATLRNMAILGWVIIFYEMCIVWCWRFVHNLPWPAQVLSVLHLADGHLVNLLEATHRRLVWWQDSWGVRFMWLREAILTELDRRVTALDYYLLRFQDGVIAAAMLVIKPLTAVYSVLTESTAKLDLKRSSVAAHLREEKENLRSLADHLDSEPNEDTEDGAEEYLSDASTEAKLLRSTAQGLPYSRQHTTATAEGRLRAAIYHRVKKDLRVMRKNSIRVSCGLVNYAKQMVEPRVRPFAESFLASVQKWTRSHEAQEWLGPLMEELSSEKSLLAKVPALARALCVACLAFLLRLVRGKKNRRTRSMRSESLRRRTSALTLTPPSSLSLLPSALQQSSEPTPTSPMSVPKIHPLPARKEDNEDLESSLSKDSALGSEAPSEAHDSDAPTISMLLLPTHSSQPPHSPKPPHSPEPTKSSQLSDTPEPLHTPEPSKSSQPPDSPEPPHSPEPTKSSQLSDTPEPLHTPEPSKSSQPLHSPEPPHSPEPTKSSQLSDTPEPIHTPEPSKSSQPPNSPEPPYSPELKLDGEEVKHTGQTAKETNVKKGVTIIVPSQHTQD